MTFDFKYIYYHKKLRAVALQHHTSHKRLRIALEWQPATRSNSQKYNGKQMLIEFGLSKLHNIRFRCYFTVHSYDLMVKQNNNIISSASAQCKMF